MSEKDQRLEDFIRKGLGQPEFAFREEDWALMEAKLDAMPVTVSVSPWTKLRWWLFGAVLFLLTFISGWLLNDFSRNKVLFDNNTKQKELLGLEEVNTSKKDQTENERINEENCEVANNEAILFKEVPKNIVTKTGKKKSEHSIPREKETIEKFDQAPSQILLEGEAFFDKQIDEITKKKFQGLNLFGLVMPDMDTLVQFKKKKLSMLDSIRAVKEEKKRNLHFAIGLTVSPDFTGTSIKNSTEYLGETYGLSAEYYYSNTLRLKLGVYRTNKIYSAGPGEYTLPKTNIYSVNQPYRTEAVCNILEVPIFIQYSMYGTGRNKLWLTSGLSSYWMQKEKYDYWIANPIGEALHKTIVIEKENKHLFSVVSIGFAYERGLSRKLSMELEPYLKVPLGGVGYGKVTLYSSGAYLTIKYHIGRKGFH